MMKIRTDEGIWLSYDDSKQLIEFTLRKDFKFFSDFLKCEGIMFSDYWGDVFISGMEEDYYIWIT